MRDYKPLESARRALAVSIADLASGMSGNVEQLEHTRESVQVYRDVGVMSPAEAERWLAVIGLGESYVDNWPYAEETVRERARDYLRGLIPSAPTNEDPEPYWQAQEFFGCIRALSRGELLALEDEFDRARGADDDEDDEDDGEPLDSSAILRTELGPSEYIGGACITSVQIALNGVIVNWHAVSEGESQSWHGGPLDALTDNLGTEYAFADSNGQQLAEDASLGTTMFTPSIPDEATELRIRVWGHELIWPLRR